MRGRFRIVTGARRPERDRGHRRYGRPWLRRAVGLTFVAVLTSAGVEVALRIPLVPLPNPLATYLFSCYEGINPSRYVFAPLTRLELWFHRPGFEGRCYFNGHHWAHRSDDYGWRNPKTWRRVDVALLGDSMIYGHGVEEADTVAHRLRERTGARVANLGVTGGFPGEYLAVLRNFALRLRPRWVAVYFFANDLTDLRAFRSPEQVRAFVDQGEAPEARIFRRPELLADVPPPRRPRFLDAFYLARVVRFAALDRSKRVGSLATALPAALRFPSRGVATSIDCSAFEREFDLELRYVERAIGLMRDSAATQRAKLVLGYLPQPSRTTTDVCFSRALARMTRAADLPFARPRLHDARGAPRAGTRLPADGHLTGAGAELVAEDLVDLLRRWTAPRGSATQERDDVRDARMLRGEARKAAWIHS